MTQRGLIPVALHARLRAAVSRVRTATSEFRAGIRDKKAARESTRQIDKDIAQWPQAMQRWIEDNEPSSR